MILEEDAIIDYTKAIEINLQDIGSYIILTREEIYYYLYFVVNL